MARALVFAILLVLLPRADSAQTLGVLHIKVALAEAEQKATPVPRHSLLISDNPATAAPRMIVTAADGTADVKLRAGNYTVESDRPVVFHGKAYQWMQIVDIVAGRDTLLELTAGNAEVVPIGSASTTSGTPLESDPSIVLPQWQDSVMGLWTPFAHGSGFVVDARGLIVTTERIMGTATSVEVQLTPALKVPGSVVASDAGRGIAVLWIDPKAIASVRPVLLGCGQAARPPLVTGQEIFTIVVPLRQQKDITPGTVSRVVPGGVLSDFRLEPGSAGGPVFTAAGDVVGITSLAADLDGSSDEEVPIMPAADACEVIAAAQKKMQGVAPPSGAGLPVEPTRPFPMEALKQIVERRAGSLSPYQFSSSDFDVAFITPVNTYGAQHESEQVRERDRSKGARASYPQQGLVRPLMDFGNWSSYVEDFPPVLLVRVTPKMAESFWTTVARGAARTQGMAIPPLKHFKSSFSRLRAFCGNIEVTPIHPFKLERRVSENDAVSEGLYVFDPGALGPQCGTVKLVLYSEKDPEKGDTRVVDPAVIQQAWQDFEPYRAVSR